MGEATGVKVCCYNLQCSISEQGHCRPLEFLLWKSGKTEWRTNETTKSLVRTFGITSWPHAGSHE